MCLAEHKKVLKGWLVGGDDKLMVLLGGRNNDNDLHTLLASKLSHF